MKSRGLVILVAVLVVLGGLLLFQQQRPADTGSHAGTLLNVSADKVNKLVITAPNADEVIVERQADGWHLTAPVSDRAEQGLVMQMIKRLTSLTSDGQISSNPAKADRFGVDAATGIRVAIYTGGDGPAATLVAGKRGPDGSHGFVTVNDQPAVHRVGGVLSYQLTGLAERWRNKSVLDFATAEVTALSVQVASGKALSLVYKEGIWQRADDDAQAPLPVDGQVVERLVSALSVLRALTFVDPPEAVPDLLLARFTVTLGAESVVLKVLAMEESRMRVSVGDGTRQWWIPKGVLTGFVDDPQQVATPVTLPAEAAPAASDVTDSSPAN